MKPGIYPDISNEAYHLSAGISKTDMKISRKSLAHLRGHKTGEIAKKETIYKDLGKALHEFVLEPELFRKTYCKPLTLEACRQQGIRVLDDREEIQKMVDAMNAQLQAEIDASGMIQSVEEIVDYLASLNMHRLPKLNTTGNKAELIERIMANWPDDAESPQPEYGALSAMKGPELKAEIERINATRAGFISTSGSRAELSERYREHGGDAILLWELVAEAEEETGHDYFLGAGKSRAQMIEWLNAHGYQGGGWRSWDMVKEEWAKNNPDRIVLSEEDWKNVHGMHAALMADPDASKLLWPAKGGRAEQSIYWNDPETGELCKCRPDFLRYDSIPVDLKTCNDASEEGFCKAIETYNYDMQEDHYLNGIEATTGTRPSCMPFVVVEPEFPYLVAVYVLDEEYKAIGKGLVRDAINAIHASNLSNVWPGLPAGIRKISPRRFYAKKHEQYLPWEG